MFCALALQFAREFAKFRSPTGISYYCIGVLYSIDAKAIGNADVIPDAK